MVPRFLRTVLPLLAIILHTSLAQPGRDGALRVSSGTVIVTAATPLRLSAAAGDRRLAVRDAALRGGTRFPGALAQGDLVLVIQMQGAALATDSTGPGWGAIRALGAAGRYDIAEVQSVEPGDVIVLTCPLRHAYNATSTVQVLRVPRWTSVTVEAGAVLTCDPWDGVTGGVLAFESRGDVIVRAGGAVDVSGRGFRGGALRNVAATYGIRGYRSTDPRDGGEKGEGVGGAQNAYDTLGGRFGRGAPANGGGGGNAHNAGGGGGGGAGDAALWSGDGIPDLSDPAWRTAWDLEIPPLGGRQSSGGGRGGYSYSSAQRDALVVPPGDSRWGGDDRLNIGGLGGRPLPASETRLFFGGGGGAGNQNNNAGGAGGNGGGILLVLAEGSVTGGGDLRADGLDGGSTRNSGNDGPGGGGGGGSILIRARGVVSGVSLSATGGAGGNQRIRTTLPNEAEGPGGGGGGGFIAATAGDAPRSVDGGRSGRTDSFSLTEFLPNGATGGSPGIADATLRLPELIVRVDTGCTGAPSVLRASVLPALPGESVLWFDSRFGDSAVAVGAEFVTPPLPGPATWYVALCPGTTRQAVTVRPRTAPVPRISTRPDTPPCDGDSVILHVTGPEGRVRWSTGDSSRSITVRASGVYHVTLTDTAGCDGRDSIDVVFAPLPRPRIAGPRVVTLCDGDSVRVALERAFPFMRWSNGDTTSTVAVRIGGMLRVTVRDSLGCTSTDSILIRVAPLPVPVLRPSGDVVLCDGDSLVVDVPGVWRAVRWTTGDSTARIVVRTAMTLTAEVTDSLGCTSVAPPLTVRVHPLPTPRIAGPAVLCPGEAGTFRVVADPGRSWRWSVDGGSITGGTTLDSLRVSWPSAGTVRVRVLETLDSSGCEAGAVVDVRIRDVVDPVILALPALSACEGDTVQLVAGPPGGRFRWSNGDTASVIRVAASGRFSVERIDTSGCRSVSEPVDVVLHPLPRPVVTASGPLTFCDGDSVTLDAGPWARWNWSSGDSTRTIRVAASALLAVTVWSDAGCSGVSDTIEVVVHPRPSRPVISRVRDTLIAPAEAQLEWELDGAPWIPVSPGTAVDSVRAPRPGTYRVRAVNAFGCDTWSDPYPLDVLASATLGIPALTASPGDRLRIPVLRTDDAGGLRDLGVSWARLQVRYDRRQLDATGLGVIDTIDRWSARCLLEVPFDGRSDTVAWFPAVATLGPIRTAPLVIERVEWSSGLVRTRLLDGSFTLQVCEEGGERLFDADVVAALTIHPNPFNSEARIELGVLESGPVRVALHDMDGRLVARVFDGWLQAGTHRFGIDGAGLASGSMLCLVHTPSGVSSRRVLLLR